MSYNHRLPTVVQEDRDRETTTSR